MCFRHLLLAAVFCVTAPALSQNICRISHREGFSNCSILSLAQDADGCVRAGSCDGLNLWGGRYARNFRLSGNLVPQIAAIVDAYLWMRTNYGIGRLDIRDRSVGLPADFPRLCHAARNCDGAFFLHGGRLAIRILPPSYASAWAWAGCVAAALAAAALAGCYVVRRRRERRQRHQALCEQHSRELLYESRIRSFANLANELSIPLTLIQGSCQQILDYRSSDGFVLRQAGCIRRNTRKLNDLICLLNEFKAAGAADRIDRVELLDITRFCNGLAQTFSEYAAANGIAYRVEVDVGLLFPSARNALAMGLNILLSNAFRRTAAHGEVAFRVGGEGDMLRVEVTNRGEGVDCRQVELLSDRYRLLDCLESRSRDGLSLKGDLGLAICRNLVVKLRGEFRVASQGELTTVTLLLPRLGDARAASPVVQMDIAPDALFGLPAAPVAAAKYNEALPTMLVVGEDRDMASFLAELFAGEYNMAFAFDPAAAADRLGTLQPQVVVCCAVSPAAGVVGAISEIRRHRHAAQVPVVLLTSCSDARIEGVEAGVDVCLTLPFNITHLKNVVEQLLGRYESVGDSGRPADSAFDPARGRLLHKEDKAFLDKMLDIIRRNILDPSLSTQLIAGRMGMSLPNFYRKLSGITDQTPACIIREYRFGMAEQLLATTRLSIDEIIFKSGFSNRSTFFRGFVARFGCTPKAYRERKVREAVVAEGTRAEPEPV